MRNCPKCNTPVPLAKLVFRLGNSLKCENCGSDLTVDTKSATKQGAIIGIGGATVGMMTAFSGYDPVWIGLLISWLIFGPIIHSIYFTKLILPENTDK